MPRTLICLQDENGDNYVNLGMARSIRPYYKDGKLDRYLIWIGDEAIGVQDRQNVACVSRYIQDMMIYPSD